MDIKFAENSQENKCLAVKTTIIITAKHTTLKQRQDTCYPKNSCLGGHNLFCKTT